MDNRQVCGGELITPRLRLTPLSKDNRSLIFALRSDPRVIMHTGISQYMKVDEADAYIQRIEQEKQDDTCFVWVINLYSTMDQVGTICFWNYSADKKSAEIGYDLLPAYWGQGYAPEAIKAVLTFGFNRYGFDSVFAYPSEANAASCRVLEKAGFQLLEKSITKNGENDYISRTYRIIK